MSGLRESYESVPYPATPYPQTHPSRIAAIATLLGMTPASMENCRVLEIGCADASNLLPMASLYPESQFIGIDLSERQIDVGRKIATRLQLNNLRLFAQDFVDVACQRGPYDIIAHGVYSWIPPVVADDLLNLCATRLSPQGIAYVSYNNLPGWHVRAMLRELIGHHFPSGIFTQADLETARAYLVQIRALAETMPGSYPPLITAAIDAMLSHSNDYWFHDLLEIEQHPVSFKQFVTRLGNHRLQYLGDAEFHAMLGRGLPAAALEQIQTMAKDRVEIEQLMDAMIHRSFRQSLICHGSVTVSQRIDLERLTDMYITGQLEEVASDSTSSTYGTFRSHRGLTITQRDPGVLLALRQLIAVTPAAIHGSELLRSIPIEPGGSSAEELAAALVRLFSYDTLDLQTAVPTITPLPSNTPRAFPLARLQAETTDTVANLRHDQAKLSDFERTLLVLLDGTRDHGHLKDDVPKAGKHLAPEPARAEERIALALATLARSALLME